MQAKGQEWGAAARCRFLDFGVRGADLV